MVNFKIKQVAILTISLVAAFSGVAEASPRGAIFDDSQTVYGNGGSTTIECLHNDDYWFIDLEFISSDASLASVSGTVATTAGPQERFWNLVNPPYHTAYAAVQIPRDEVGEGTFVAEVTGVAVSVGPLKQILPASCSVTF
jgi:hypothetical protein